jgi:hypothetical protein
VVEKGSTGTGFLRVLRFSLATHCTDCSTLIIIIIIIIIRGWYNRPVVASVIVDSVPLHSKKKEKKKKLCLWRSENGRSSRPEPKVVGLVRNRVVWVWLQTFGRIVVTCAPKEPRIYGAGIQFCSGYIISLLRYVLWPNVRAKFCGKQFN